MVDPVPSSCMHRSLNASQRALIAAGFLEYEREQAKARLATSTGGADPRPMENFPQAESGAARDKAGERMHVSGRIVENFHGTSRRIIPDHAGCFCQPLHNSNRVP
jgi:hypothetical protein